MRALSIWQPWATLIVEGCKPFEFRTWRPAKDLIGQRIVIHSGQRPAEAALLRMLEDEPARLIASCGIADETRLEKARDILRGALTGATILPLGAGIGTVLLETPVKAIDLFARDEDAAETDPNMWAIPVSDPEIWDEPVLARGAQGFWNWTAGAVDGSHHCHAIGCTVPVAPKLLMCAHHWRLVPPLLQRAVWKHYRPGQETDKRASSPYLKAAGEAIRAVALLEGRQLTLNLTGETA